MDRLSQMLMMGAARSRYFSMPFGTFTDGGYFAGIIQQGGDLYAIILAPRSGGQGSSLLFKTSNTSAPAATRTLNDGPTASASMGTSSTYPAARFCNLLTLNGFSDWYLPARDELELCHRNLKASTGANSTVDRQKSTFIYPEGDDLSSDTNGLNRNSMPSGAAYTAGDPAQTPLAAFQEGGSEAFLSGIYYWSSSEFSSGAAWGQLAGFNGRQLALDKAIDRRVRAVRRVKI